MSLKPKVLKFNRYASHAALKKSLMSLDTPRFQQQDSKQKQAKQLKDVNQIRSRKNTFWTKKGVNINGSIQSRPNGQSQHNSIARTASRGRRALSGKVHTHQQSTIGAQKISFQRQFLQIPNNLRAEENIFHQHNSKFNIILKHQKQLIQEIKPILQQSHLKINIFQKAYQELSMCLKRVQQIKLFDQLPSLRSIVKNHIEGSSYVFSKLISQYESLYKQKFTDYGVILNDMKKQILAITLKNEELQNENKVLKMISVQKNSNSCVMANLGMLDTQENNRMKSEIVKMLDEKVSKIVKQMSKKQCLQNSIPLINYQRVCNDSQSSLKLRTGAVDIFCQKALSNILINQAGFLVYERQRKTNQVCWKNLSIQNSILEVIRCTENSIPVIHYLLSKQYKQLAIYNAFSSQSPKKGSPQKKQRTSPGKSTQKLQKKSPNKRRYSRVNSSNGFTLVEKLMKQLISGEADIQVLFQIRSIFLKQVQRIKRISKGFNIKSRDKMSTLKGIDNKSIKVSLQQLLILVQKVQFLNKNSRNAVDIEFQNTLKYELISKSRTESGSSIPQHYLNSLINFFQTQDKEVKDNKNQTNSFSKDKQKTINFNNPDSQKDQSQRTPLQTFYQGNNICAIKSKRLANCLNLLESRSMRMRNRTAKQAKTDKENVILGCSQKQSTSMNTIQSIKPNHNLLFTLIPTQKFSCSGSQSQQHSGLKKNKTQQEMQIKMKHLNRIKMDPIDCMAAMYYYFMEQLQIMRRQLVYEATKSSNPYSNKNYLQRYMDNHINLICTNQINALNQTPSQSCTLYQKHCKEIKKVQNFYERAIRYSDRLALNPPDINKKQCLQNTIELVLKSALLQYFSDRAKNSSNVNSPNKNNSHMTSINMTSINTSQPNSEINSVKYKIKVSKFE